MKLLLSDEDFSALCAAVDCTKSEVRVPRKALQKLLMDHSTVLADNQQTVVRYKEPTSCIKKVLKRR